VNTVTKKASLDDEFTTVQSGFGTAKHKRFTLDTNQVLADDTAVRFNALYTDADIPNRAPAAEQRQGFLLSGVHQATDDLKVSADIYHFRGDDRTDAGIALNRTTGAFNKYGYVGQDGLDFQETAADILTVTADYHINDAMKLQNKTRYGETKNDYIVSIYSARSAGLRSFTGWQDNTYLGNQTNLIIDQNILGKRHTIVAGIEYAKEGVEAGNYTVTTSNSFTLDPYNPDNSLWEGSVAKNDASSDLTIKTVSAYLMDTVTLNEDWEVFGGVRYDYFDYSLWKAAYTDRSGNLIPEADYAFSDGFWNGHLGVVFSPWEHGNVYASWSTSSNINGGEADAGTNCGYGGLCMDSNGNYTNAEPEQSTNYEIGTKWNLMDEKLLATAAIFQTTKDKVIEGASNSYTTTGSLNTGKNRVEGIEFGLAGKLTPKLTAQLGLAIMDSETLKSYDAAQVGLPKANFADKSANLQLKYQATPQLAVGGTATYSSEIYGGQPDAGANESIVLPDYTVYDLFAEYKHSKNLSVRANLQNVTDEEYYTAIYRGGSIVYLGDARSANVTLTYKF
jgi:catecholate siderophore receptor